MVQYDSSIIEQFAVRLYKRARSTVVVAIVVGVLGGGVFFAGLASGGNSDAELGAGIFGALLFGIIGYFVGQHFAFHYRLMAQTALCQAQIERNTRAARQDISAAA